jgi:hypothetical protein
MSIKPFLGLLLVVFAVRKRWAALAIALTTAIGCFAIGIVALGWPTFLSWIHALRSITWAAHIFNASLFGFIERLVGHHPESIWELAPLASAPGLVLPLWLLATAGVGAVSAWFLYRRVPADATELINETTFAVDRMFAVTLSAALLISPLAWVYYVFFLAGPFIALCADTQWRQAFAWRSVLFVGAALALTFAPGTLTSAQPHAWATFTIGSGYFWSLLAFWICALPGRRVTPVYQSPGAPRPRWRVRAGMVRPASAATSWRRTSLGVELAKSRRRIQRLVQIFTADDTRLTEGPDLV